MFSGISCLFCVNYGHSVMSELRSDSSLNPPTKAKLTRKQRAMKLE
jgi:hypothetical protein